MEQDTRLLPVVELDGTEYLIDIEQRQFREVNNSENKINMHSEQGREMIKAMQGTEWRRYGV